MSHFTTTTPTMCAFLLFTVCAFHSHPHHTTGVHVIVSQWLQCMKCFMTAERGMKKGVDVSVMLWSSMVIGFSSSTHPSSVREDHVHHSHSHFCTQCIAIWGDAKFIISNKVWEPLDFSLEPEQKATILMMMSLRPFFITLVFLLCLWNPLHYLTFYLPFPTGCGCHMCSWTLLGGFWSSF